MIDEKKTILAARVERMEESATIKMAQIARELTQQGKPIISLSLGEPDFDTPEHIKAAAKQALDEGFTKYTPVPGILALREAICTKLRRDNQLEYTPSQIVVSNGAKQCIANLALSLFQKGDEVIIFSPYWVSYSEIIKLSEAEPCPLYADIDADYKVTPDQLRAAITPQTRGVLFSSPCNPTGSVYTREELEALVAVLRDYPEIYVISDEIYEYINFTGDHCSIAGLEGMKERAITVNGFSKGYAMTGWRLGYLAAPQHVADACAKIQGQFTSGANSFGQKAAIEALLGDQTPTETMRAAFLARRDLVLRELQKIEGIKVNQPKGAFYVFPDISAFFGQTLGTHSIQTAEDFCLYLLEEANVATVTGEAFGAPNCFRISYAASEAELTEALQRIQKALAR